MWCCCGNCSALTTPDAETWERAVGARSLSTQLINIQRSGWPPRGTLQVRVMFCTAQTLIGRLKTCVLDQSLWLAGWRLVFWCLVLIGSVAFLAIRFISLFLLLPSVVTFRAVDDLRRLHHDGWSLLQVLSGGRLSDHDSPSAVHSGRRFAVQISVGFLPATQLGEMLLLNVSLGHLQF